MNKPTKPAFCQHARELRLPGRCGCPRQSSSRAVGHSMSPGDWRTLFGLESNPLPQPDVNVLHLRSNLRLQRRFLAHTLVQASLAPVLVAYRLSTPSAVLTGMRRVLKEPRVCPSTELHTTLCTTARLARIPQARWATPSARHVWFTIYHISMLTPWPARSSSPDVRHAEERHLDRRYLYLPIA